ncbi:MAG: CGNR zinc finger domain-containing protein [Vicinamibacteraceae bacterium]
MRLESGEADIEFELTAGERCLDFANTVTGPDRRRDLLPDYDALVAWSQRAGLVAPREAGLLRRGGARAPRTACAVLVRARRLRELVFRVFASVAVRRQVAPEDLDELAAFVAAASRHRRLTGAVDHFEWRWTRDAPALDRMLWPIAQSAADLLTSEHVSSVRECAAPTCAWLFLDQSRNQTRRWCDMKVCGNRAKVRRFHQRAREH